MTLKTASNNRAGGAIYLPSKEASLKTLSYRLNLLNWYLIRNVVCNIAGIHPKTSRKYSGKHDNKSYLDMKKKHIRQEAIEERLQAQREILKALRSKDAALAAYIVDNVNMYIVAEGYRI